MKKRFKKCSIHAMVRKPNGRLPPSPFHSAIFSSPTTLLLLLLLLILMSSLFLFLPNLSLREEVAQFPTSNHQSISRRIGHEEDNGFYPAAPLPMAPNTPNNLWIRLSNSIYLYSAYVDTRGHNLDHNEHRIQIPFDSNWSWSKARASKVVIRIIGLLRPRGLNEKPSPKWLYMKDETFLGDRYFCRIFFTQSNGNGEMEAVNGTGLTYKIFEEGVKVFAGTFFNCYAPAHVTSDSIRFVALYPLKVENYPDKLIPINKVVSNLNSRTRKGLNSNSPFEAQSNDKSISVCVRPLFGFHSPQNLSTLVQFIAYYEGMGASVFTFYDFGIGPLIQEYLGKLASSSNLRIQIHSWNLPTGNVNELWDFGSLSAINDCFLRRFGEERWLVVADVDEFIVPQLEEDLSLQALFERAPPNAVQLLVRNAFFCQEFCNWNLILNVTDADVTVETSTRGLGNSFNTSYFPLLPILECKARTKRVWNAKLRAKYVISRPEKVFSLGHHTVTGFLNVNAREERFASSRFVSYEFSPNQALLNHYRKCQDISTRKHPILTRLTIQDASILRFEAPIKASRAFILWGNHAKNKQKEDTHSTRLNF